MTRAIGERERLHVAVLPFTVPGDNPELRAFADGLMESLTSGLSQYEGLNNNLLVVPASEVRRRRVATAADAHSRFNVNYVVQGTLDTQGERVRLQLALIDTDQMRQIETARVEDSRLKALNLQDGALARLGNLLDLAVRPNHASDQSSLAPGVHEFYLQGLGYLQRSDKTDNIHLAISLFERALELDREYALGYAGLAESYRRLYDRTTDPKWIDRALSNCERALQLNRQLPKVLVTAGQVYGDTGRYKEALAAFSAALDVDARNSEAFEGLARTYTLMERYDEAVATHQKAIMLRPGDWRAHSQLGVFYFQRDEFHKAIESFRTVVALTPDSSQAYSNLAAALHRVGQLEDARVMYERSIEIEPRAKNVSSLGALLSSLGQRKEALQLYERAVEIEDGDHGLWANLGSAYDAIGDPRAREAFLRAAAIAEAMLQVNPGRGELHSALAHYYAGAGDSSRAERSLGKAELRHSPSPEELANNAATCARLGLLDRALMWSEKALRSGYPAQDLAKRRWLAPLAGDPRFQKLQSHYTNRR
jgi:tetratricopeptide (TPR) repeat protein